MRSCSRAYWQLQPGSNRPPRHPRPPPPATDIYELPFDGTAQGLKAATPRAVATDRGYDNQPLYTPDGAVDSLHRES